MSQFFDLGGEDKVRYTAGLGVWIPTPVGPLKLGYGQRIGHHPIRSSGRFFVVFGQAF
jgi:outer membrane protein assembly factor BamA